MFNKYNNNNKYIGRRCKHSVSRKKAVMAAINMDLQRVGLENIFSFPHLYKSTIRVLQSWTNFNKENPTAPKKADKFKAEEIAFILSDAYPLNSPLDFQDLAFFALTSGAAMRSDEVYRLLSRNVSRIPYDPILKISRKYEINAS